MLQNIAVMPHVSTQLAYVKALASSWKKLANPIISEAKLIVRHRQWHATNLQHTI